MPSTYTHYSLSKEILALLPKEISNLCKTYETQFQMGAQGPDFFYFYRPIRHNKYTKLGKHIHDTSFLELLKYMMPVLKEKGTDSMEYAYILGFITHFTLDSIFHPYVIPQVKKLHFRHTAMETEFDRHLMLLQNLDPFKYPLWKVIPKDQATIECVSHLFHDIPKSVIKECIKTYHFYRRAYHTPNKLRYYLVKLWFRPRKRREYFGNLLYTLKPREKASCTNPELTIRYRYALKVAVENILIFHNGFVKNHPIDEIFNRNFK